MGHFKHYRIQIKLHKIHANLVNLVDVSQKALCNFTGFSFDS